MEEILKNLEEVSKHLGTILNTVENSRDKLNLSDPLFSYKMDVIDYVVKKIIDLGYEKSEEETK